eukprot:5112031-Prymnesium_polylepis.1
MRFSRRTARGCIPRCVYQRHGLGGLERPCLSRWLDPPYSKKCGLRHARGRGRGVARPAPLTWSSPRWP